MTNKTDATPHSTGAEASEWTQTLIDLAAAEGEMRGIHHTKTKDQTPEQLARLDALRTQCRAIGARRRGLMSTQAIAAPAVQSDPSDAALIAQRDAWKAEAEHQYGRCWQANGGEDDYPVVGALDAYVAKKYAALAQPVLPTSPSAQPAAAQAVEASKPVAWMNKASLTVFNHDRERYPLGGGGDMATARYMRSDHHNVPLFASQQPAAVPAVAQDYCAQKMQPRGCQLHNLQCNYPACNQPPAAVPAVAMTPMIFDDGRKGWYIRTPDFYCDIEPDAHGKWSIFFRESTGAEAFADQAVPAVAMTGAEMSEVMSKLNEKIHGTQRSWGWIDVCRAVEAHHGIPAPGAMKETE